MLEQSLKWRADNRPEAIRWVIVFYLFSLLALIKQCLFVGKVDKRSINRLSLDFSLMCLLKQKQVKCTERVSPIERVKP
jgi:hypothetical protein